jgi:hypothetical protein
MKRKEFLKTAVGESMVGQSYRKYIHVITFD